MTTAAELPSRYEGAERKIPESLSDMRGPDSGFVSLPIHLVWSGLDTFDVANPKQRVTMYCILLDTGQRADFVKYANGELLRQDWPLIRRRTSRLLIAIWERCLPELAAA